MYEYNIDFTNDVPPRYCPTAKEVAALYIRCVPNGPMDMGFREVKKGVFEIKVFNEKDKNRLENKFVLFDYGEKVRQRIEVKVPLILREKRVFYKNPKWITIDKIYDSVLSEATNQEIDEYFSKFGKIIAKTHDDLDEFQFRNGKKKLRIDLQEDIERWLEMELKIKIEGKEILGKGRVKIFYRGQPYKCYECKEVHTEKCPEKIIREESEREAEKVRKSKIKSVLVGDSNLRHVNKKAFLTNTECATGAKIGHVANALKHIETDGIEVAICHVGQNNINDKQEMGEWENKLKKR